MNYRKERREAASLCLDFCRGGAAHDPCPSALPPGFLSAAVLPGSAVLGLQLCPLLSPGCPGHSHRPGDPSQAVMTALWTSAHSSLRAETMAPTWSTGPGVRQTVDTRNLCNTGLWKGTERLTEHKLCDITDLVSTQLCDPQHSPRRLPRLSPCLRSGCENTNHRMPAGHGQQA